MPSDELKTRAHEILLKLEADLVTLIKVEVFDTVSKNTKPGGESEGTFIKRVLRAPLETHFGTLGLAIEGVESKGLTQFKKSFFGRKPALDVVVRDLELVGEVKYCKLDLQKLALAIGQPTMYVGASVAESMQFSYGLVVFCDTTSQETYKLSSVEESFKSDLWEKKGVFLILM